MTLFKQQPALSTLQIFKCLTVLFTATIFCGCAVPFNTVNITQPTNPYGKIAMVIVNCPDEIKNFDEQSFDELVRPTFNNLKDIKIRTELEKSFESTLNSANTTVIKSADLFHVNENVSYNGFMSKLKNNMVEAVLVIDINNYWGTAAQTNNIAASTVAPNPSFLCYLIDIKSSKLVWLANAATSDLPLPGGVGKELLKAGFIYKPGLPEHN